MRCCSSSLAVPRQSVPSFHLIYLYLFVYYGKGFLVLRKAERNGAIPLGPEPDALCVCVSAPLMYNENSKINSVNIACDNNSSVLKHTVYQVL